MKGLINFEPIDDDIPMDLLMKAGKSYYVRKAPEYSEVKIYGPDEEVDYNDLKLVYIDECPIHYSSPFCIYGIIHYIENDIMEVEYDYNDFLKKIVCGYIEPILYKEGDVLYYIPLNGEESSLKPFEKVIVSYQDEEEPQTVLVNKEDGISDETTAYYNLFTEKYVRKLKLKALSS